VIFMDQRHSVRNISNRNTPDIVSKIKLVLLRITSLRDVIT
jgi:hypothetical protein